MRYIHPPGFRFVWKMGELTTTGLYGIVYWVPEEDKQVASCPSACITRFETRHDSATEQDWQAIREIQSFSLDFHSVNIRAGELLRKLSGHSSCISSNTAIEEVTSKLVFETDGCKPGAAASSLLPERHGRNRLGATTMTEPGPAYFCRICSQRQQCLRLVMARTPPDQLKNSRKRRKTCFESSETCIEKLRVARGCTLQKGITGSQITLLFLIWASFHSVTA